MRDVLLGLVEARGTLEGRFTRIRRLGTDGGRGHFSLVFLVEDTATNSQAILKVFNPEMRTPDQAYRWESFLRESRNLEKLVGQKDIIQLVSTHAEFTESIPTRIPGLSYDIPFAYYVMEKGEGDMLEAISDPTWGAQEYLEAFHCMVRAVQRIHAARMVHRDLKPDNFLLTEAGVKLSDFGTARFLNASEPPMLPKYDFPPGDVRYTAPEIFALMHDITPEISFKADFFALGAILFEMFAKVNLGVQLFGSNLLRDLTVHLSRVSRADRSSVYHQIVNDIARAHPLPSIQWINPSVTPCIRDRLNQLYKELCNLNYQNRNCHFPSVFRQIQTCSLILRNETQYQRWQAERQRHRTARLARKVKNP